METVLHWQQEHMLKCHAVHDQHNGRLTKLEEWKWKEAGAITVFAAAFSWAMKWVLR